MTRKFFNVCGAIDAKGNAVFLRRNEASGKYYIYPRPPKEKGYTNRHQAMSKREAFIWFAGYLAEVFHEREANIDDTMNVLQAAQQLSRAVERAK